MTLLNGITVLDFSQFLAGPSCALRLADLGARVIKIERPAVGDSSRHLVLKKQKVGSDSLLFHTINRNKESIALNLKDPKDKETTLELIKKADVLIENNRPGVMKKLGLDYDTVKQLNPKLIYGTVTGYGISASLAAKPGQDLLAQSLSGLTFLNGNADQPPTPFALSVADSFAGIHLAEGILSCLIRRNKTNTGGLVEVSLLESAISLQFEVLTSYFNDGQKLPERSNFNNAHAYLAAPYGIYQTKDGYLSIAMGSLNLLGQLIGLPQLSEYEKETLAFTSRDEIKQQIAEKLVSKTTDEWAAILLSGGYWAAPVYNWQELIKQAGFKALNFDIQLTTPEGSVHTTGCPIRVNGSRNPAAKPAPLLDQDHDKIMNELGGSTNE
ncbi:CoA transferase [Candidatus Enterococcus murrayae]|uniref:CoA transferase n=1 Tax=Candidatus Enterococcus murrayae TaxID=2815321 RepID=A0ABS3HDB6_9ENTE|nr:CoA transferase [Enterococcus sp. MJM16]